MARTFAALVLALAFAGEVAQAFYLPGVAPQDFKKVGNLGNAIACSLQQDNKAPQR